MNILAFDTSSAACSVALLKGNDIHVFHQIAPMQQAQLLLPAIQQLLSASSLTLKELNAIAYGSGPGSFTGIRIASSVVQGLAFAANLPVIKVSSLAIMAQTALQENQWEKLLVAVDARVHQVYWAAYEAKAGSVVLIGKESVGQPEELPVPPQAEDWYGIGDGWEKYGENFISHLGFRPKNIQPLLYPNAKALLTLAKKQWEAGDGQDPFSSLPAYLR